MKVQSLAQIAILILTIHIGSSIAQKKNGRKLLRPKIKDIQAQEPLRDYDDYYDENENGESGLPDANRNINFSRLLILCNTYNLTFCGDVNQNRASLIKNSERFCNLLPFKSFIKC